MERQARKSVEWLRTGAPVNASIRKADVPMARLANSADCEKLFFFKSFGLMSLIVLLAGCELVRDAAPAAPPRTSVAPPAPREATNVDALSPLVAYYADVEGDLIARGRMRLDTSPADAPFSVDDLVRNFEKIALYDEYVDLGGRFIRKETPALLRRWDKPIRVGIVIGPSASFESASRDRAEIMAFAARLARLTSLDMQVTDGPDANFLVMILSSEEQAVAAPATAARFPGFQPAVLGALSDTPLNLFCTAYAFAEPDRPSAYAAVMVLIRAEHPPLTRLSCVHEEMSQAMGLPNDYALARPSLFNGNVEFAFLTEHDEILLRMLYDPRLRPGMTVGEARPLLPAIARDAIAAQAASGALAGMPLN
jgi:hypothetical protein